MPAPILGELTATVTRATTVAASATALINGFAEQLRAAIEAALANGATAEELAPFTDLETALENETNALEAAVIANTPAG